MEDRRGTRTGRWWHHWGAVTTVGLALVGGVASCSSAPQPATTEQLVTSLGAAQSLGANFVTGMQSRGWVIDNLAASSGDFRSRAYLNDCDAFGTAFEATAEIIMTNPSVTGRMAPAMIASDSQSVLQTLGFGVSPDDVVGVSVVPRVDSRNKGIPLQVAFRAGSNVARVFAFTSPTNIDMAKGGPFVLVNIVLPCQGHAEGLLGPETASRPYVS